MNKVNPVPQVPSFEKQVHVLYSKLELQNLRHLTIIKLQQYTKNKHNT